MTSMAVEAITRNLGIFSVMSRKRLLGSLSDFTDVVCSNYNLLNSALQDLKSKLSEKSITIPHITLIDPRSEIEAYFYTCSEKLECL